MPDLPEQVTMSEQITTDNEQARLWNGPAGQGWVEAQELLDHLFQPFEDLLLQLVVARGYGQVLDVGCGTGATTLAFARQMDGKADCTGIDISDPMIALARQRARHESVPATFICADAQNHDFPAGRYDTLVSRFGVMFFNDPVTAFGQLRRATKASGELHFIAWRSAEENPFMTTAERAAAPLLPRLPARRPNAPGQFAFANPQRIREILDESGWRHIDIQPLDVACSLPERDLVRYVSLLGPVGVMLRDVDAVTRSQVIDTVRAAFAPYVQGEQVRFDAACWMVSARATVNRDSARP
jgi:ubiquinone/menaquinone biosynthesis C-methylase UbiE